MLGVNLEAAQTLERLDRTKLFTTRNVSGNFVYSKGKFLSMRKLGSAILREASPSVILRAEGVRSRALHRGTVGRRSLKRFHEHASLSMRKTGQCNPSRNPSVIPRAEGVTSRASHRGTVGLECFKERASLEAKVHRFVNVQALTGGAGLTLHDTSRVLAFGVPTSFTLDSAKN